MLFSPPQRLSPQNSLRTQDDLRLTPIQWNPLSILVHRTRRPNITTTVIATTLISIPHDLDRLNGGPITTIPQRIARGIALVHLLTVPHLDKIQVSDTAMTGVYTKLFRHSPGTDDKLRPQQASQRDTADEPSSDDKQENSSACLVPPQKGGSSFPHRPQPAVHHHPSAQLPT